MIPLYSIVSVIRQKYLYQLSVFCCCCNRCQTETILLGETYFCISEFSINVQDSIALGLRCQKTLCRRNTQIRLFMSARNRQKERAKIRFLPARTYLQDLLPPARCRVLQYIKFHKVQPYARELMEYFYTQAIAGLEVSFFAIKSYFVEESSTFLVSLVKPDF